MSKILVGMAAAALWFALSQAVNAERICKALCDNSGTCVSQCVDADSGAIIRDRDPARDDDPGMESPRAPGADIETR